MTASLFERLGGVEGITNIANDTVANHFANPIIGARFSESDLPTLQHAAATFFIQGTGGPEIYQGKDMLSAHKCMNISAEEFMAVLDDALDALNKNSVGQREQEEVLFALYSMREDIIKV